MTKKRRRWEAALYASAFLLSLGMPGILCAARGLPTGAPTAATAQGAPAEDGHKLIALTFDDGPRRSSTTRLLDGLAQRGTPATFFLVGKQVGVNEDVVRRMEREGHQVGIHTYDHVKLTGLNAADFAAQIDRTRALLTEILGHNDFRIRPPYGMTDGGVKTRAHAPIILWSIDPEDWNDQNADREVALITAKARDGGIILMHDIFDASVEAALRVVDALHAQGYLFVTVDELFAQRQICLEPGRVYWNAYP